jgi:hypothetical protein
MNQGGKRAGNNRCATGLGPKLDVKPFPTQTDACPVSFSLEYRGGGFILEKTFSPWIPPRGKITARCVRRVDLPMKNSILPLLLAIALAGCAPKSELAKANSDLAAAQEKIKTLEQDLADTRSSLEQAEGEISSLQPLAAKARQLPVRTRIHHVGQGSAYNLVIRNESRTAMRLFVVVTADSHAKTYNSVVEAGKIWVFPRLAVGDVIEIASEGYDTTKITVP